MDIGWFLFGCHQLQFLWLSSILVLQGYEANPLWVVRVTLCMGWSVPHQGGRHMLVNPPDMEGYLPITPPKFGLANHDPVL